MKTSLKPATRAEKRRFIIITQETPCVACKAAGCQAHHLISETTGNRISHAATVGLCPSCHHDIHNRKRWFHDKYGTNAQLLSRTNKAVDRFELLTVGATA